MSAEIISQIAEIPERRQLLVAFLTKLLHKVRLICYLKMALSKVRITEQLERIACNLKDHNVQYKSIRLTFSVLFILSLFITGIS